MIDTTIDTDLPAVRDPVEQPTKVLPDQDYLDLLRLNSEVVSFGNYESPTSVLSKTGVQEFKDRWKRTFPILQQSIGTWKEGKKNFFRVNTPYYTLASFVQTASELQTRGYDFSPLIDEAQHELAQIVDDCGEVLREKQDAFLSFEDNAGLSALRSLSIAAEHCSDENVIKKSLGIIESVLPHLASQIQPSAEGRYRYDSFLLPVLQMLRSPNTETKETAQRILDQVLQSDSGQSMLEVLNPTHPRSRSYYRTYESDVLQTVQQKLEEFGVQSDGVMQRWHVGDELSKRNKRLYEFRAKTIPAALRNLRVLHETNPQIAPTLQQEFGLENFYWYPPDMLISQFDNRDDNTKPYGLVWTPKIDEQNWTNAQIPAIHDLFEHQKDNIHIRFFESKNKLGPQGYINNLQLISHRSGESQKASFLLMLGHSWEPGKIHFGNTWTDGSYFTPQDIPDIASYFIDSPSIVLASCDAEPHFRSIVQSTFLNPVQAPDELLNRISSLTYDASDGIGHLAATFIPISDLG